MRITLRIISSTLVGYFMGTGVAFRCVEWFPDLEAAPLIIIAIAIFLIIWTIYNFLKIK